MEILEIRSMHDLTTKAPGIRSSGVHSYWVNCRQFGLLHRDWQRQTPVEGSARSVMTLSFEQIWITEEEGKQVAAAIKATHSPIALD